MAYLFNDQLKGALFRLCSLKICPEKPPLSCQVGEAVLKVHTQNFGEYSLQSHQVEVNLSQSCPEQSRKDPTSGQSPDPLAPEPASQEQDGLGSSLTTRHSRGAARGHLISAKDGHPHGHCCISVQCPSNLLL